MTLRKEHLFVGTERKPVSRQDIEKYKTLVRSNSSEPERSREHFYGALLDRESGFTLHSEVRFDFKVVHDSKSGRENFLTIVSLLGDIEDEKSEYLKLVLNAVEFPEDYTGVDREMSNYLFVYRLLPIKDEETRLQFDTFTGGQINKTKTEIEKSRLQFDTVIGGHIFDLLMGLGNLHPSLAGHLSSSGLYDVEHINDLNMPFDKYEKHPVLVATDLFLANLFRLLGPINLK